MILSTHVIYLFTLLSKNVKLTGPRYFGIVSVVLIIRIHCAILLVYGSESWMDEDEQVPKTRKAQKEYIFRSAWIPQDTTGRPQDTSGWPQYDYRTSQDCNRIL